MTVPLPDRFAERPDFPGETPSVSFVRHTFSSNRTGQLALSALVNSPVPTCQLGFNSWDDLFDEATVFRVARAYEREHAWSTMGPEVIA